MFLQHISALWLHDSALGRQLFLDRKNNGSKLNLSFDSKNSELILYRMKIKNYNAKTFLTNNGSAVGDTMASCQTDDRETFHIVDVDTRSVLILA